MEELGLEFHAFATSAGVLLMKALMEAEEKQLAGERQSHATEVNCWGNSPGSVMVGGQKVALERTRLRTRAGKEVRLESYDRFHSNDARARPVYERLIAAGLLHAEKRMRRIKGYRSMSVLRAVLEAEAARKARVKQTNAA